MNKKELAVNGISFILGCIVGGAVDLGKGLIEHRITTRTDAQRSYARDAQQVALQLNAMAREVCFSQVKDTPIPLTEADRSMNAAAWPLVHRLRRDASRAEKLMDWAIAVAGHDRAAADSLLSIKETWRALAHYRPGASGVVNTADTLPHDLVWSGPAADSVAELQLANRVCDDLKHQAQSLSAPRPQE